MIHLSLSGPNIITNEKVNMIDGEDRCKLVFFSEVKLV